jgi:hypothetical protein
MKGCGRHRNALPDHPLQDRICCFWLGRTGSQSVVGNPWSSMTQNRSSNLWPWHRQLYGRTQYGVPARLTSQSSDFCPIFLTGLDLHVLPYFLPRKLVQVMEHQVQCTSYISWNKAKMKDLHMWVPNLNPTIPHIHQAMCSLHNTNPDTNTMCDSQLQWLR